MQKCTLLLHSLEFSEKAKQIFKSGQKNCCVLYKHEHAASRHKWMHSLVNIWLRDLTIYLGYNLHEPGSPHHANMLQHECHEHRFWMETKKLKQWMCSLQIFPGCVGISMISSDGYRSFKDHGAVSWTL